MATATDQTSQNPAATAMQSASSMSWREKMAQQAMRVAMLPTVMQEQAKSVYENLGAQKYAKHNDLKAPDPTGEDMGIHLGDQIINYPAPQQSQQPNASTGLSTLGKAAVVAGALGAGSLLPTAGQAILGWFNKPAAVAQPAQSPAGAFELKLVPPEQPNQ